MLAATDPAALTSCRLIGSATTSRGSTRAAVAIDSARSCAFRQSIWRSSSVAGVLPGLCPFARLPVCCSIPTYQPYPRTNKNALRRHRGERRSRCHPSYPPTRRETSHRTRPRICGAMSWALISVPTPALATFESGSTPDPAKRGDRCAISRTCSRLRLPGPFTRRAGAGLSPYPGSLGPRTCELLVPFSAFMFGCPPSLRFVCAACQGTGSNRLQAREGSMAASTGYLSPVTCCWPPLYFPQPVSGRPIASYPAENLDLA